MSEVTAMVETRRRFEQDFKDGAVPPAADASSMHYFRQISKQVMPYLGFLGCVL